MKNKKQIKEIKLKSLSPTLRVKKRFIKIKINLLENMDFDEISYVTQNSIQKLLGNIQASNSGFWILKDKFDYKNKIFIIKCSLLYTQNIIGCLALISKINKQEVRFDILRISGTLKGLEKII